jgi:hypothetical protein
VQVQQKKRSKGRAPVVTAAAVPTGKGKSGSTRAQIKKRTHDWHVSLAAKASSVDGSVEHSDSDVCETSGDEDLGMESTAKVLLDVSCHTDVTTFV